MNMEPFYVELAIMRCCHGARTCYECQAIQLCIPTMPRRVRLYYAKV
jgi:hypothetical protein